MKIAEIPERILEGFEAILWSFGLWRKQDLRWLSLISQPIDYEHKADHSPWMVWRLVKFFYPQRPHMKDDFYLELLKREYANYWKEILENDSN